MLHQTVDVAVRAFMAAKVVPAASVAIAEHGEITYCQAFGLSNVELNVEATPETVFRTASIAKPITGFIAMRLVEEGKLDLDRLVKEILTDYPGPEPMFTTRQLLNHTAGIRAYEGDEFASTKRYASLQDALKIFAGDTPEAPGLASVYSTYSYTVAGRVMEVASGKSFPELLREYVTGPMRMTSTEPDDSGKVIADRVGFYSLGAGGKLRNADLADSSYKIPGGGLLSNAKDLAQFGVEVLSGKYLSAELTKEMFTPRTLLNGDPLTYGVGWETAPLIEKLNYWHTGGQQGTSTVLCLLPESETVIVALCNQDTVDAAQMLSVIYQAWKGQK